MDTAWQKNRAGEEQVWVLKAGQRNPAGPCPWHVWGTLLTSLQSLSLIPAQLRGSEKSSSEGQVICPRPYSQPGAELGFAARQTQFQSCCETPCPEILLPSSR